MKNSRSKKRKSNNIMQENEDNKFQMWADSFHEGDWACSGIAKQVKNYGGTFTVEYLQGFIPHYSYELNDLIFSVTVFGNYDSWTPKPLKLDQLLAWGKPDLVLVSEASGEILLAVEETAATPTGNQALQRCERQFGSAMEGFPFWYLIAEYGIHSDGGTRRDSIWPTLMGLEIMNAFQIPSIVLHYADLANPEDYESGTGLQELFHMMTLALTNQSAGYPVLRNMQDAISKQIDAMESFIDDSWSNSLYAKPGMQSLDSIELSNTMCSEKTVKADFNFPTKPFLEWPRVDDLSQTLRETQNARPLIKKDPFAERLENAISSGQCYGIVKGSGSRPQKESSLNNWINEQNTRHSNWLNRQSDSRVENEFRLLLSDFPRSPTGRHVVTAPRILYLFDHFDKALELLKQSFPRLKDAKFSDSREPALVYISNSVKPGRIFGDPYTGQISAYAVSFGALAKKRKVIAYFPHQSIAQAADNMSNPNNKGLRIMAELTDLLVFGNGLTLNSKTFEIL